MSGENSVATTGVGVRLRRRLMANPTINLVVNLTMRSIRSQYKRTILGRLWSLVNPLATIATFSIVFGLFFRVAIPPGDNSGITSYALFVACGIIPWSFLSQGITNAMGALTDNEGLLTKVYFPRHTLVTSSVLSQGWTFLTELGMLALVMGIAGGPKLLLFLPLALVVMIINMAFVLGVSLVLSISVVYFRDVKHIWTLITQIWFYASGIVFPISIVIDTQAKLAESGYGWVPLVGIFEANPAYQFVDAYRAIFFSFDVPSLRTWLEISLAAVVALGIGIAVFNRFQGRIVEEL